MKTTLICQQVMFFTLKGNKNSFSFLIKEAIWGYVSIFSLMGLKTLNNEQAEKNVSQLRMSYLSAATFENYVNQPRFEISKLTTEKLPSSLEMGLTTNEVNVDEMADQKQNENVMKEMPYLASNLTVFLPYTMRQKSNFCLCP